jgi:hypothetical protein
MVPLGGASVKEERIKPLFVIRAFDVVEATDFSFRPALESNPLRDYL